jgi:hypothetical protein
MINNILKYCAVTMRRFAGGSECSIPYIHSLIVSADMHTSASKYSHIFITFSYFLLFLTTKHEERLRHHEKVEAIELLDNTCIVRRLQGKKAFELI